MGTYRICALVLLTLIVMPCLSSALPPPDLTLAAAIERALASRASISAAAAKVSGVGAVGRQAALRPNPIVSFQSENWRFHGTPDFQPAQDLDLFAYVTQTIETGGKKARRVDLAAQDLKIAELEQRALEWNIRQEVRQAFLRLLMAQRQLELIEENGRYFEQIIEYHRVRVEQGAMPEADLIRVRLERERLNVAENAAAVEAEQTRVELLRTIGSSDFSSGFKVVDTPAAPPAGPPLDQEALMQKARSRRFEALLGQAMVEKALAEVEAQKAQAKPDWEVALGYKRTAGFNTLLAAVSVPLPIFNRNEGRISGSRFEVSRSQAMLRGTLARIEADVAQALAGVRRRRALLDQMEKGMIERAEESLRISLAAYQEGGSDLLRLLDAQRVRNEVQLLFARTQMEYRLNLAGLEEAVGEEQLPLAEELFRVEP